MKLLEFQAKRLFAAYGIPVPQSVLVRNVEDMDALSYPVMLKAQILKGKRGKAGGIQRAVDRSQAVDIRDALLGREISGYLVQTLLAESSVDVEREMYLSLLMDKDCGYPLFVGSAVGGTEVEDVAEQFPDQIARFHVDPCVGLSPYMVRSVADALELEERSTLGRIMAGMYALFEREDATLVEINPLAQTAGDLIALDAKMVLDDNAAFRHRDLHQKLRAEQEEFGRSEMTRAEALAQKYDVTYVLLDGDVGLIADGAGTGMASLDLIEDMGGLPANFCEMGGLADADTVEKSMEVVLANPRVTSLLITLIGGLTRMDHMGKGIARYVREQGLDVPLVVRMCGTQEEMGKRLLREAGLRAVDDLSSAVREAVMLARGGHVDTH